MKVLVFGNSGSGKSTYARALATREGLAHLDLDSIVWGPGEAGKIAVQRPDEAVAASLRTFIDSHPDWVIEVAMANWFERYRFIARCWFSSTRGSMCAWQTI